MLTGKLGRGSPAHRQPVARRRQDGGGSGRTRLPGVGDVIRQRFELVEELGPGSMCRRQWDGLKRVLAFYRDKRTSSVEASVASPEPRRSRGWWLIVLAAVLTLATIAGVLWRYLNTSRQDDGVSPPPPDATEGFMPSPPVEPEQSKFAPPDAVAPEATLPNPWPLIDRVSCAVLTVDANGGRFVLGGHAGPPARIDALAETLKGIKGVSGVVRVVSPLDAVHCQPVDLARPHAVANRTGGVGLSILPDRAVFNGGDELQLKVGGASRDGYLYVDYYSADGTVLHMLPRPRARHTFARAGSGVAIGEGGNTGQWSISAPYGQDLVVAILSPQPLELTGGRREEVEPTADYLPVLKAALDRATAGAGKDLIAASLAAINTQPPRQR